MTAGAAAKGKQWLHSFFKDPVQSWIFKSRCRCQCHCWCWESPDALNDRCRWFPSNSLVFKESPREGLFKDRYFVRGIGSGTGTGTGIAIWFKDPALVIALKKFFILLLTVQIVPENGLYRCLYRGYKPLGQTFQYQIVMVKYFMDTYF